MRMLLFIFLSFGLFACGGETTSTTTTGSSATTQTFNNAEAPDITIQVAGATPGWMFIIGTYTEQQYKLDSAMIDAKGVAHFKRDIPYDQGFVYFLLPDKFSLQGFVSEDQTFSMKTTINDPVGQMVVNGSVDNELLYRNLKFETAQRPMFNSISSQLQQLQEGTPEHAQQKAARQKLVDERMAHLTEIFTQYPNALFTKFKKAGQNPIIPEMRLPDGSLDRISQVYNYRMQFWNDVDWTDERLLYTPVISNKLKRYIDELTPQNPDSILKATYFLVDQVPAGSDFYKYFTNWVVTHYDPKESTLMDPQAVFANMIQKYFTYDKAFWADSATVYSLQQRAYEMAASLVGKKAPDVEAPNPSGQLKTIYGLDAPYIIVYMYTPSCEHCAVETPKLVQFYNEWKSKGVEVYGIAIDTDHNEWTDYIAKNQMQWTNVHDPSNKSIYAKYFVDVTPELYLLNPDRTIIAKNLKVEQVATMIERDMAKRK